MKCQKCNQHEANTHITQVINGVKTEMFLCHQCANENQELFSFTSSFENDFENIFGGFMQTPHIGKSPSSSEKCPVCGISLSEILSHGRPGCSNCYSVFSEYFARPLKQIHGNLRHSGKIPAKMGSELKIEKELKKLELKLDSAIKEQNFEEAAIIRDKIKSLKIENRQEEI